MALKKREKIVHGPVQYAPGATWDLKKMKNSKIIYSVEMKYGSFI